MINKRTQIMLKLYDMVEGNHEVKDRIREIERIEDDYHAALIEADDWIKQEEIDHA